MPRFNGDTSISSSMDTHYNNHNRQEMISQPSQPRKPSLLTVNFVPEIATKPCLFVTTVTLLSANIH